MNLALVASVATIIGGLVAVLAYLRVKPPARGSALAVRRVRKASDSHFMRAMDIYGRRIPDEERDDEEDIARWLQEVEKETRERRCKLRDYFLVATHESVVCGFLYFHYYPDPGLAFISYLVVDSELPEGITRVTDELLGWASGRLRRELKDCTGFVTEVDDPVRARGRERTMRQARIRRFRTLARRQNFVFRVLEFPYIQPRVSLKDRSAKETPMLLMYARVKPEPVDKSVSRDEVSRVMSFVYNKIYGDHFENREDDNGEYRDYLRGLLERQVVALPIEVPVG